MDITSKYIKGSVSGNQTLPNLISKETFWEVRAARMDLKSTNALAQSYEHFTCFSASNLHSEFRWNAFEGAAEFCSTL